MSTVLYYDDVIPPKEWLIYASLLWEKVWVGPTFQQLVEHYALQVRSDNDGSFLDELLCKTDIIDTKQPAFDWALLDEGDSDRYRKALANLSRVLDCFIDGVPFEIRPAAPGAEPVCIDPVPKRRLTSPDYSEMRRLSTLFHNAMTPAWVQKGFQGMDFFFADQRTFRQCHSLKANVLVSSVEAVVPVGAETISIAQLLEFRENTRLHRARFSSEADRLCSDLFTCSTEDALRKTIAMCEEYIRSQVNVLQQAYISCKLEAAKKVMGVTFAGPALIGALASALHVPFYVPVAIAASLSLAGAEILLALEKGKTEIEKSPWGYLYKLRRL